LRLRIALLGGLAHRFKRIPCLAVAGHRKTKMNGTFVLPLS
jgi:hypothetical protein